MASTNFDVVIGGTSAKIKRGIEGGGYKRRTIRREIEQNLLSQSETPALVSRADQRQMYQNSWAGGSRWWKPLLGPTESDSYFQSNHMDTWSEPGKVVPDNQVTDAANTSIHDDCVVGVGKAGAIYAIGDTNNVNASFKDVYKWTPASNAFVQETGYHSGVDNDATAVFSMAFDINDEYFYVVSGGGAANGSQISRFNPDTPAQNAGWIGVSLRDGMYMSRARDELLFYNGWQLYKIDKVTPTETSIFDDGLGPDFLWPLDVSGTAPLARRSSLRLGIASPEGFYYVKNTFQNGQPTPWVFRVELQTSGTWVGQPIATLPVGTIALSLVYHLGSVIISATPDWQTLIDNDTNEAEIVLYFVSGQSGLGSLGSILGGRGEMDETPYALMGTDGPYLYIGGQKRLWLYDAIRGGIHTGWEWTTELSNGPYVVMVKGLNSSGESVSIFLGRDRIATQKATVNNDPDTVAAFGDDETHYVVTSNYFDFGIPFETKELTKVEIFRESDDGGSEWTVQAAADGGSFADILVHSTTGETYASADLSGTTGKRFQYQLIYQTKDTARKALEGLKISATTGEMVTEWDFILDGEELLNIDNEPQDPEDFYDNMVTLGDTATITTLVDNFQEKTQDTDTGTTTNVKVRAVEIDKSEPGEASIRVVLREA